MGARLEYLARFLHELIRFVKELVDASSGSLSKPGGGLSSLGEHVWLHKGTTTEELRMWGKEIEFCLGIFC